MVEVDFQCFPRVFDSPADRFLLGRRRKRGTLAAPDTRADLDASIDASVTPRGRKRWRKKVIFLPSLVSQIWRESLREASFEANANVGRVETLLSLRW